MAAALQAAVASQVETESHRVQTRCGQRSWRGEEEEEGGLAKRVVARKARSNDVCLALKERVCVGGVEDTGFGTGMMGEGTRKTVPMVVELSRRDSLSPRHPPSDLPRLPCTLLLSPSLSISLSLCLIFISPSAVSTAVSPSLQAASLIFLPGLGPRLVN